MLFNTPIQMEWFYYVHYEKSKLNWFLFETALEYYDFIKSEPELSTYRKKYTDEQIGQYCTYYSRRMKQSVLKHLRGRTKSIVHHGDDIGDFYPHHTYEMNMKLQKVALKAWDAILPQCRICPQGCLIDYESESIFFSEYAD